MSPEHKRLDEEIINPSTSDFKIEKFVLSPQVKRNKMVQDSILPDKPRTLTDILPVLAVSARQIVIENRKEIDRRIEQMEAGDLAQEKWEEMQGYSWIFAFVGAGGRGKGIMEELVHEYLDSVIQNFSRRGWLGWEDLDRIDESLDSSIFWHNWEELRNFMYVRGAFDDLKDIYTPFSEKDLNIITRKYGEELANRLWEGGLFLVTKPAGTYGYAKTTTYYNESTQHIRQASRQIRIVERAFGPGTLPKLSRLQPPFDGLSSDTILYAANAAITASTFVLQILDRYRAAIQFTENDLDSANEVQHAFGRPLFKSREELSLMQATEKIKDQMNWYEQGIKFEEMREGSNMKQLDKTQKAIRRVVEEYWFNGYLSHLPYAYRNVLEKDILGDTLESDKYVFKAASRKMREGALEVSEFITTTPSYKLLADIVRDMVYEKAVETVYESSDLEIGEFYPRYENRPLEPLMSIIINNAPDIKKYKSRASAIRRVFRKYKLAS